jgi:hypothetical protein
MDKWTLERSDHRSNKFRVTEVTRATAKRPTPNPSRLREGSYVSGLSIFRRDRHDQAIERIADGNLA